MDLIRGRIRVDRRTKELVKRLRRGEMAVIHHADLDGTAARALIEAGASAVINASKSITGRYPNQGPLLLLEAGTPLVDEMGDEFFEAVHEGEIAELRGDTVTLLDGMTATGKLATLNSIQRDMELASQRLSEELESFVRNTLKYVSEEKSLLADPIEVPAIRTNLMGRHTMIVVRGEGYKQDLRFIEGYLRDVKPVLIGVDGGADALLEVGLRPDIILGDMDSVSDRALRCGAELIVHGYQKGDRTAPGYERLKRLGLNATIFHAPGTSEDVAMLLADALGARLIIAVGTHFSLVDFLDKGREGMASTFLTRLRIGSKLVDAKGIGRLWEERGIKTKEIMALFFAALFPIVVLFVMLPQGRNLVRVAWLWLRYHFQVHG
ncbi:MAG: putative cytokinetic ring protein SteA [Armatimonadetes bacterium]|nr:putative cytokinetic ring protein SteA [Armatimonadota bacterium]